MIQESNTHTGDPRSSREVEQDIRRTRSEMDQTLEALNERLSPRSLLNDLLTWFESRDGRTGSHGSGPVKRTKSVTDYVSEHPLPALMTGAGIVWMLLDSRKSDDRDEIYAGSPDVAFSGYSGTAYPGYASAASRRATAPEGAIAVQPGTVEMGDFETGDEGGSSSGITERLKEKASSVGESLSGVAGRAQSHASGIGESISGAAGAAQERLSGVYERSRRGGARMGRGLQESYGRGEERFARAVDDYPLAVGVGMIGLGLLVGLLLPHTRYEDELMGEESDRLTRAAKEKAEDLMEHGKEVAQQAAEGALDEAQKQGLTVEKGSDALSSAAGKIGAVIERAKSEATTAVEEQSLTPEQLKQQAEESAQQAKGAAKSEWQSRTT